MPVADMETVYSVDERRSRQSGVRLRIAAPNDPKAAAMLKKSPRYTRIVRTEDLRTSTRLNALFSSADPELFPGQTFLQTSAGGAHGLKSSGETPFVFGINESDERARRPGLDARRCRPARRRQRSRGHAAGYFRPAFLAAHGTSLLPRHAQARRTRHREVFGAAQRCTYRCRGRPRQGPAEVLRPSNSRRTSGGSTIPPIH